MTSGGIIIIVFYLFLPYNEQFTWGNRLDVMIKAENLLGWFDRNKKEYPWGKNKSPYFVWISEIMLQQTVAASVIPYFEKWIQDYPDVNSLAMAELSEVLSHWEGLGYYSRCRNLHKTAQILVNDFSNKLPDTYKELISLQGIGDYTSRAILSIAFKQSYAVLDANVRRIIQRLTAIVNWQKGMDRQSIVELEKVIPHNRPGDFNEAMMQLGQQVCTATSPKCDICPLAKECLGLEQGIAEKIPVKLKKKIIRTVKTALLIYMKGKLLLRRKKRGLFHDLWLVPLIPYDKKSEVTWMGTDLSEIKPVKLNKYNHYYTDYNDVLYPYLFNISNHEQRELTPSDDEDFFYAWIELNKLDQHPSPSVYRKIFNDLKDIL